MKSYGKPYCPEELMDFDASQHPLLNDVWKELKSHNPGLKIYEIFEKYCGRKIAKYPYGTYRRSVDISEKLFVFIEQPISDDAYCEEEYEFAIFLEDISNIELFVNEHPERLDAALQEIERQAIIDAINRLPDVEEIRGLKASLAEDVKYLGEYYHKIGLFEMTPDKKESRMRHPFNDFNSFRVEFLKLTKQALDHGNRPDFEFGLTWYDYLAAQLQYVVNNIASYFEAEVFSAEKFGNLLQDIYLLAYKFDFSHSDPFSSIIHKGQQGILKDKSRGVTGSQTRLEKTKDQRKYYLQLCVDWYIKAFQNFDSPELPTRQINIAFKKWFEEEKKKEIKALEEDVKNRKDKKTEKEMEIEKQKKKEISDRTPVIPDTLNDWRRDAGLDEKEPITHDRILRCCIAEELDENSIKNVQPAKQQT